MSLICISIVIYVFADPPIPIPAVPLMEVEEAARLYRELDLNEQLTFESAAAYLDDASIDVALFNLGSRKRASPRKPNAPNRAQIRRTKKRSAEDSSDDSDSADDGDSADDQSHGDTDDSCSESNEDSIGDKNNDECKRTSIKRKHSLQTEPPCSKRPAHKSAVVTLEDSQRKRNAASIESDEDSPADSVS